MPLTRFDWDYTSMGAYLRTSPDLKAAVFAFATDVATSAKGYAPVGPASDKHPGAFRDSIHAEPAVFGGSIGARVVADSPDALQAEFGRKAYQRVGRNGRRFASKAARGSHALKQAGDKANSPKRRA